MSVAYCLAAWAWQVLGTSWLRTSQNTLPDKPSLLRNLACGDLPAMGNMTALSKPGLGWKRSTLKAPLTFFPGGTGGQRARDKTRQSGQQVHGLDCFSVLSVIVPLPRRGAESRTRAWLRNITMLPQRLPFTNCADTALNRWIFSQERWSLGKTQAWFLPLEL